MQRAALRKRRASAARRIACRVAPLAVGHRRRAPILSWLLPEAFPELTLLLRWPSCPMIRPRRARPTVPRRAVLLSRSPRLPLFQFLQQRVRSGMLLMIVPPSGPVLTVFINKSYL